MEDEIARLRQALEDERRLREEEQRRREEEQRRREEEQRRREEAETRASEEQRRREEAEKIAEPLQLEPYLEACHALSLAIKVVTDRSLTTQGDTTNPAGRVYPRRILPWDDFPARQEDIWNRLFDPSFASRQTFPSQHQLDYVQSLITPISSEHGLRYYERDTVENAVQKLVDAVYENPVLRASVGLRGTVTFESHTNLGTIDGSLSEPSESAPLSGASATEAALAPPAAVRKRRRLAKGKGKGSRADQFCIYRTSDGANVPATAIEYKAPHKLSQDELVTGLVSEIQPDRDVINKDGGEDFAFAAKALATAVVTQLFSYMVGRGIQYGYVCTGQVFVFLHIPDDPAIVYYYVCVPNQDVLDDDENRLHRTAVAQVFAFIVQSLCASPPPLSWHDAAASLDIWDVEYDDVLSRIPPSVRKDKRRISLYKPQRWQGFTRSPIRTRSHCSQVDPKVRSRHDDDDEEDTPPSPSVDRQNRPGRKAATSGTSSGNRRGQRGRGGGRQGGAMQQRIQDQPYCTHKCLLGVVSGGPFDQACPNAGQHGSGHISQVDFLHSLRAQLAKDRGPDADSAPLYLSGSVGSLFKLRLSAHGYTLVAKGVEAGHLRRLSHEKDVYDQLQHIQGNHVPVCLGLIRLDLPYYYDGGEFKHFLLLSWAGQPLSRCIDGLDKKRAIDLATKAYTELHRLQVLHVDAEPRNILYDAISGSLMVIDFERAELRPRQALGLISPNGQGRKRKRGWMAQKQGKDDFTEELQSVVERVSMRFGDDLPSGSRLSVSSKGPSTVHFARLPRCAV